MDQRKDAASEPSVSTQSTDDKAASPVEESKKGLFDWGSILVGGLSALAGILGTPYGIYVAGAVGLVAAVGFFFAKSAFKDWKFKNDETRAGAKAGSEASTGQEKLNKNRDQVDDFFGRDRRS